MKFLIYTALLLSTSLHASETHTAQGVMSREPTHNSVILQTRLTTQPASITGTTGAVAGMAGTARFEVSTSPAFTQSTYSEWLHATPENDFIIKTKIHSLQPATTYYYRIIHGTDQSQTSRSTSATTTPTPLEKSSTNTKRPPPPNKSATKRSA